MMTRFESNTDDDDDEEDGLRTKRMCIAVFAGIKNSNPWLPAGRKGIGQEKVHGFLGNETRGQHLGEGGRGEEEEGIMKGDKMEGGMGHSRRRLTMPRSNLSLIKR